jgi:AI-2 transport system ATP-binding protein
MERGNADMTEHADAVTPCASRPMLSVRGIYKSFSMNAVLKGIDLDVDAGEVMALVGGNGAGKSTLMKIVMGIYQPDSGEIYVAGVMRGVCKPSVSIAMGVYLVPQEPMLFPNMTVEENVMIGSAESRGALRRKMAELMERMGWKLDLSRKADTLSIAEQQLVEILRGLLRQAKVLILDEPTSALTFNEASSLFQSLKDLKNHGISIIYITHRLAEVFEIATSVAIMRDGVITLRGPVENFTREMLLKGLLPPDAEEKARSAPSRAPEYEATAPVLRVKNLSGYGFSDVSLDVYPGEVLGLAGVLGAGRTELATTIFGRDRVKSGSVSLNGRDITGLPTDKVMSAGLNYVPEDRYLQGIFRISDVAANVSSAAFGAMSKFFMNFASEKKLTQKSIGDFSIKVTGQDQTMGSLSGGNQQKVVIARALSTNPSVIILDEPTRGIDAAARRDVYAIISMLKERGVAILLISSDMEEVVELSDRALAMYRGRIDRCFRKEEINQDNLMAAAFGIRKGEAA